jgi:hypothetical protein
MTGFLADTDADLPHRYTVPVGAAEDASGTGGLMGLDVYFQNGVALLKIPVKAGTVGGDKGSCAKALAAQNVAGHGVHGIYQGIRVHNIYHRPGKAGGRQLRHSAGDVGYVKNYSRSAEPPDGQVCIIGT